MPFVNVPSKKSAKAPTRTASVASSKKPGRVAQARRPSEPAKAAVRAASLSRGNSRVVVQLGAYSNPDSVLVAWNKKARRFRSLAGYAPMSARFASAKGTFYRLSVKGFGSVNEATALCSAVRHSGGSCFVRNVAGDTPVQIASR